jgi:hypothetical protein
MNARWMGRPRSSSCIGCGLVPKGEPRLLRVHLTLVRRQLKPDLTGQLGGAKIRRLPKATTPIPTGINERSVT